MVLKKENPFLLVFQPKGFILDLKYREFIQLYDTDHKGPFHADSHI